MDLSNELGLQIGGLALMPQSVVKSFDPAAAYEDHETRV